MNFPIVWIAGAIIVIGVIYMLVKEVRKTDTHPSPTTPETKPAAEPPKSDPKAGKEVKPEKKGGGKLVWLVLLLLIAGYYWRADVLRFVGLIRQVNAASSGAQTPVTQGYVELPEPLDDPDVKSFVIEVGPEPSRVLTEIPANHHVRVGPVDKDPRKRVEILPTGSNYSSSCKDSKNGDCWIGKDTPIKDAQIRIRSVNGDRFLALVRYSPVRN